MGKIKGFPMKIVTDGTMTDQDGKQQKNQSATNVTVLREEPVAKELFERPADYTETPLVPGLDKLQSSEETGEGKTGLGGFMDMLNR